MIYFIHNENRGAIKIGYTIDPPGRMVALQVASPDPLRMLKTIDGERADEARLHLQFSHLRLCGEWFKADYELLRFIYEELGAQGSNTRNINTNQVRCWLWERFRESPEWRCNDLFALAQQEGIKRNAVFEARRELGRIWARVHKGPDGRKEWTWIAGPPASEISAWPNADLDRPDAGR